MTLTLRDLLLRLRALIAPRRAERDLSDELNFHVDMETRRHAETGLGPADAAARARARFGSTSLAAEQCRDVRGTAVIETGVRDIAYAIRSLRRTPAVAATVVLTIALGLGLMAAVFIIFNAFVFRPDAVADPGSLYSYSWFTRGGERHRFTYRQYEALRRENEVFSDVIARRLEVVVRIEGRQAMGQLVTGNFFEMLGVGAARGRPLVPADSAAFGGAPVIVLSYEGWQRLFARADVVGRTVRIHGFPYEVAGVAPEGFRGLDQFPADFWAPLTMVNQLERRPWQPESDPGGLEVIGRLKPGMSAATARAGLAVWTAATASDLRSDERTLGVSLDPAGTAASLSFESLLAFSPLFAAFGLILLIGCANVANLMLARGLARQREIAIRLSLGASRGRVVRQLLTESLLLALAAAGLAVLVSRAVVDAALYFLLATVPAELAEIIRLVPFPTDFRVAAFLVVAAVVSTVLFGLMPALAATRSHLLPAFARPQKVASFGAAGRRRSALIVIQVTSSALLLICAGIFLRSAGRAAGVDPGLRVDDTLIIDNAFDEKLRPALVSALAAEPLVDTVVAVYPGAPILGRPREATASAASAAAPADQPATYRFVSPEYFNVFGIDLLAGRTFTHEEAASRAALAVVSESAARRFWPDGTAVGQWLRVAAHAQDSQSDEMFPPAAALVIGVAHDVPGYAARGDSSDNTGIYLPTTATATETTLIAHVKGDPEVARRAVTDRLASIDPTVGLILKMRTLAALRTYPLQVAFWVTVALGTLALVLTLSGLYGVLSYLVVQRTKEIGVRMALGATAGGVTREVLTQSLRLVRFGLAGGAGLALAASTLLASVLPVEGPFSGSIDLFDGVAYAASLLTIVTACALASSIPALRAARISPAETLRHE